MADSPRVDDGRTVIEISSTLEGKAIALTSIAALPCHDFDYPAIRCFDTVERLLNDVEGREANAATSGMASAPYVIAYDYFNYAGNNPKVLSNDEAWLALIGWNDTTSSFKSFGATGRWWENSPSGGFIFGYGSTTQVAVLSATYNDRFSAFEID
jgi:hypothetical protein